MILSLEDDPFLFGARPIFYGRAVKLPGSKMNLRALKNATSSLNFLSFLFTILGRLLGYQHFDVQL